MVTIYDIAKRANVSHMTVSRVLNSPHLVSEKTREKILKTAKEMGYKPNLIARSMRTKKTNYIGLILPDIINPFFPEIVRGASDSASKLGYNIILVNTDNDYAKEQASLEMLFNRGVDGVIHCGIAGGKKDKAFIEEINENKLPCILIDRYIPDLDTPYVISNNFELAYEATEYLIKLGHKNIGVISSPLKIKIHKDRLMGYKQALEDNNLVFDESLVVEGEENIESGAELAKQLLADPKKKISAIFTMCDFLAFGVYKYCKANKIPIPDGLSIISIDDIYASSLLEPPLTTMAQKKYEMGFNAAKILIDAINNKKMPQKKMILKAKLVKRESCKKID